ncbi:hypothetical protein [Streptomyces sp. NPDC058045]|uniref:SCO2584 family spore wall biosynthesis protein n=1 Tax=Streptomyces sp. NPDC058045 TaxID=3346311 RepID=UPI0036E06618
MPEDVGGTPSADGREPDDDHGMADEEFATVVFDEDFVRAAAFHEPSAVERLLAAAEARAEAEAHRSRSHGSGLEDDPYPPLGPDGRPLDGAYDEDDLLPEGYGHGGPSRWHRPVAWLLALVMGVGMVALAFAAVYRGASSGGRQDQVPPPASTEVERTSPGSPPAADPTRPPVSAAPGVN